MSEFDKEMVGAVGSGLVSLPVKGMLPGKPFAKSWPAMRGEVSPQAVRPQMPEY